MDIQGLIVSEPLGHVRYDRVRQIYQFQGTDSVGGKAQIRDSWFTQPE
jgi:hypothetical protein